MNANIERTEEAGKPPGRPNITKRFRSGTVFLIGGGFAKVVIFVIL